LVHGKTLWGQKMSNLTGCCTRTKPHRLGLTFLFLLIILSCSSFASTYTDYNNRQQSFAEWREDGRNSLRTHRAGATGNFPSDWTGILNTVSVAGDSFQPIIFDYGGLGNTPTLTTWSGNFIEYYSLSSDGVLTNLGEYNVGSSLSAQPIAVDYGLGKPYYIFANSSDIIVYNGSGFVQSTPHFGISTGIACQNFSDNQIHCVFGGGAVSGNVNITEYVPINNSITNYNISVSGVFNKSSSLSSSHLSPIITDWDIDGVAEIIFVFDSDMDGKMGFISVNSITHQIEVNIPDLVGLSGTLVMNVGGLIAHNLDDIGDVEVCFSGNAINLFWNVGCYNSDGTLYSEKHYQYGIGELSSSTTNPVLAVINGKELICAGDTNTYNSGFSLICFDGSSGSLNESLSFSATSSTFLTINGLISSGDLNSDGNDEIISGSNIFMRNSSNTLTNYTYSPTTPTNNVALVDMNGDGYLEIISMSTNNIVAYSNTGTIGGGSSNASNEFPFWYSSVWASYANPVCVGTNVIFSALEDVGSNFTNLEFNAGCNYINDFNTDNEKLYVDCDHGGLYDMVSNYSINSPYVSCNYSTIGTFIATFCLTDNQNPLSVLAQNFSAYCPPDQQISKVVSVVNGISGKTCNLAPDIPSPEIVPVTPPNSGIDELTTSLSKMAVSLVTGFFELLIIFWKYILGLIIWAGITITIASYMWGKLYGAIVTGICSLISFVLVSIFCFGLWVLLVVGFFLILIFILILVLKG
jgi:hypothetical protein